VPTKVLIVEDHEDNLRLLAKCLEFRGIVVEQALNGSEALQSLECEFFDVVVSDVRMPELNGFELARLILDNFGSIPVVLMTADPTARMRASISESGVSSLLIKPFHVRELVEAIRRSILDAKQS
jgi:two-component system alkaline phosphatase synthesis response regulator PhoP